MNRTLTYKIDELNAGLLIRQFLRRNGYSHQNLTNLLKMPNSVLIDGHFEYMAYRLKLGDTLTIHIQETNSSKRIPPAKIPLDIVYEDEDIIVINKSAKMPIHPSMNHYTNSVANGLAYYYQSQNKPFIFRCMNRLDRDTSGLTVIAKHMLSANLISQMVKQKEIRREYLAIIGGTPSPLAGTINAPIARKTDSIIERMVDFEQGETAITHYRTLKTENEYSLVWLELETGRTHQIRVHMKHLGFPLIGDYLYNSDIEKIERQALHSFRLSFSHPITGKQMVFTAPLPEDMASIISFSIDKFLPDSKIDVD